MYQAASQTGTSAQRISFAGTLKVILTFSPILQMAAPSERAVLYRRMLCLIALQKNTYRPDRTEPRLIKRQNKRYGFLKTSRLEAKNCLY
jgi:hypothetical protein